MNNKIIAVISWIIVLWSSYIFLGSLPYKFSGHPDTQHIFSTIGTWLGGFLGNGIGNLFTQLGAYIVGSFELITAAVLLSPALFWVMNKAGSTKNYSRARLHQYGGLMAAAVMAGAVFFHLFSPLGIEVLHNGENDGGSLFKAAVSVLIGGLILFFLNRNTKAER